MAKVLCVLYDDPVDGYPTQYARDEIPQITSYPGGQTAPSPHAVDFTPGELLGSVSGELGLRGFLEGAGHTLIVTSDKDGPDSAFERELVDADIVISQPFWPAYLTRERIARASSSRSPPVSGRITTTCKQPAKPASPSPRSPTPTASASRSMW
jgi:formate dehydrogenase